MRRAANGDFYFGTAKGLFRSTDEGGSLDASSRACPRAACSRSTSRAPPGEVWACVDGVGLFRSTDHGASWAARKTDYDIQTFAISPHDRKRILIAGANAPEAHGAAVFHRRRRAAGAISTRCPSRASPRPSTPSSRGRTPISSSTPPTRTWSSRRATSTSAARPTAARPSSGPRTTSTTTTCTTSPSIRPTGPQMALAMQDRLLVFTENGHDWVWDDAVGAEIKAEVERQAGLYRAYRGRPRRADPAQRHAPPDHLRRRQRLQAGHHRPQPERRQPDRAAARSRTTAARSPGACSAPTTPWTRAAATSGAGATISPRTGTLTGPVDISYEVDRRRQRRRGGLRRREEQRRGDLALDRLRRDLVALGHRPRAVPADRQHAGARDRQAQAGAACMMVTASGKA